MKKISMDLKIKIIYEDMIYVGKFL